jgi:hypothetical protein
MSWTTSSFAVVLGVMTATGVDQATPVNNGTFASGSSTTASVAITSTNGDLTLDTVAAFYPLSAPTQTSRWNDNSGSNMTGAGSTGPGTGTATHTWTLSSSFDWASSGANFKADRIPGGAFSEVTYVSRMRQW